jgi:hypothetical protein
MVALSSSDQVFAFIHQAVYRQININIDPDCKGKEDGKRDPCDPEER